MTHEIKQSESSKTKPGKRDIIAIIIFLLLVLVVWNGIKFIPSPEIIVLSENGGYDFRGRDFQNKVYQLSGYWETWVDRHYTPEDFERGGTEPPVPSNTLDYTVTQFATHKLTLQIPAGETYGLRMRSADYAMRLFINGVEIDTIGIPGATRETTTPRVNTRTYYFTPDTETTTIIVHTANFVHREGAYPPIRPIIGKASYVGYHTERQNMFSDLIMGALICAVLFHAGLFALNRKRKASLIFALVCLFMLYQNDRMIISMFPEYDWQILFRLLYLNFISLFVSLIVFLDVIHPGAFHKKALRGYYIFAGLTALTLLTPSTVFTHIFPWYTSLSFVYIAYILYALARFALRNRSVKYMLSLAGLVITLFIAMGDFLATLGIYWLHIGLLTFSNLPVAMLFFVFAYTLVISLEYAETEQAMKESLFREREYAEQAALSDLLNRMKSEFIGNISHEIRTPLTIMSGYAQSTREQIINGTTTTDTLDNLDAIRREADRLSTLASSLLKSALSKETKEKFTPYGLEALLRRTFELCRTILAKKDNTVELKIGKGLPDVVMNPEMIHQGLLNIITNANRHTEDDVILITAEVKKGYAEIAVIDNGSGMPTDVMPDALAQVFTRGFSLDGGFGLGLSLSCEIIEAHGGYIEAESGGYSYRYGGAVNTGGRERGFLLRFGLPISGTEKVGRSVDSK